MEEKIKELEAKVIKYSRLLSEIAHKVSDEQNQDYDDLINNVNDIQILTEDFK